MCMCVSVWSMSLWTQVLERSEVSDSPEGGITSGCDQCGCWEMNWDSLQYRWAWLRILTFSRTSLPHGIWKTPGPNTWMPLNTENNMHKVSHFGGKRLNWIQSASWTPMSLLHSKSQHNSPRARCQLWGQGIHLQSFPFFFKAHRFFSLEWEHPCSNTAWRLQGSSCLNEAHQYLSGCEPAARKTAMQLIFHRRTQLEVYLSRASSLI